MNRFAVCLMLLVAICTSCAAAPTIVIRNNYDMPYSGPITFKANVPDGNYSGKDATGGVTSGVAHIYVKLAGHGAVRLSKLRPTGEKVQPLLQPSDRFTFGLVAIPGRTGTAEAAVSSFQPLDLHFDPTGDGAYRATALSGDYQITVSIRPSGGTCFDIDATVTNTSTSKDATYLALVRRTEAYAATGFKMRWNGRILDGDTEPDKFEGSWGACHCVDWFSWKSQGYCVVAASGFTPGLSTESAPGKWQNAGHTYVWEHVRRQGDALYFISEISGPDPSQKPGYKGIKAYMPPLKNEPVKLHYRLAISPKPDPTWQESQFLVSAGYRKITTAGQTVTVDLGVPAVEFGASYFPYSTMCENFDYLRTPSLDREGWWPFAPKMWENWRAYAPQMRTDLRIIRAMGFGWVRMHHLELINEMDRTNALAFVDFYMNECRKLGLKVLIDTEGTPEWFATLAGKYKDVAKRIEIENEILIPGITPGEPERWAACYKAAKQAAPETDVFLTGSCNVDMFDRLDRLGVPYDRLGYHTYKHGPGADETLSSLAVGMAGVAADKGKTPILSEFNWKFLTRMSPEARAKEYAQVFGRILEPRQVPELLQFHWQETLSVNPRLTRQGIRHYETIYLDRRPKPEAFELMNLIRRYSPSTAPIRELPIKVKSTVFKNGSAWTTFTVTNATRKTVTIKLTPECFGDAKCTLTTTAISLRPGEWAEAKAHITLPKTALPGVYHFFVRAALRQAQGAPDKVAYGWGYALNYGVPDFDPTPALPDLVEYPTGTRLLDRIDWTKPVCVAFGADCSVPELEMAYMIANTLQSATGRSIRLCSTADIPAAASKSAPGVTFGTLILVGTPKSNPLIESESGSLLITPGKGCVELLTHKDAAPAPTCLILTGDKPDQVQSAATDFVLRYWKAAKDSTCRLTGLEKGAALGNKAAPGLVNAP